MSQNFPDK